MTTSDEPKKKTYRTPGKKRKRGYGEGAIYQRADGMWVGVISLPPGLDGKRRRTPPVYSKDRKKVLAKLDEVKDNLRLGIEPLPKQKYTVEQWMRKWLEEIKKPTIAPGTVKVYASYINQQIVPAIGHADLATLTPDHIRYLIEYVATATKEVKGPDGVELKPRWSSSTAQLVYDQMSSALDDATKQRPRLVRENVAKLVHRPKAGPREEHGSHTAEQARAVLTSALAVGDPLTSLWAARYITGLRQGELLGLRLISLDFEELTFDVSWQLKRVPLKPGVKRNSSDPNRFDVQPSYEVIPLIGAYALARPKAKKPRVLPMPTELALILVAYLKGQAPNEFGLMWVAEGGRPISAEDESAAWYAAQERAGVPIIKGHGTRHTANSLIPMDETQRMKFLGHSSAVVNRRYLHEDLAQLRAGQNALAGMVLPERIVPTGERR